MQKQWVEKNVDLEMLRKCVEDFFKKNGFKIVRDESGGGYKISLILGHDRGMPRTFYVKVSGDPNDFVLEVSFGEHTRSSKMFGLITTMLGGGALLLRDLKSQEVLEKLEKEFWVYVEDAVARLVGSARYRE